MSNKFFNLNGLVLLLVMVGGARAASNPDAKLDTFNSPRQQNERRVDIDLQTPRDYGYSLGDQITLIAQIRTPIFYRLETSKLPNPGPITNWLQLTEATPIDADSDYDYALAMTYQIFKSVPVPTELTLPPLPLHFSYQGKPFSESVPAWSFNYNPLIPRSKTDGQIELEPETAPLLMDTGEHMQRLLYLLVALATVLFHILWFYGKTPFLERYSGAFGKACRTLKKLKKQPPSEEIRLKALQCFHHALNELAGETVFAGQLPEFFERFPKFAPLRENTESFFRVSQQMFFNESQNLATSVDLDQIESLCLHYRKLERSLR